MEVFTMYSKENNTKQAKTKKVVVFCTGWLALYIHSLSLLLLPPSSCTSSVNQGGSIIVLPNGG